MDEKKVANLLQIPIYFDLEIYIISRQEKVSLSSWSDCCVLCHGDRAPCIEFMLLKMQQFCS